MTMRFWGWLGRRYPRWCMNIHHMMYGLNDPVGVALHIGVAIGVLVFFVIGIAWFVFNVLVASVLVDALAVEFSPRT